MTGLPNARRIHGGAWYRQKFENRRIDKLPTVCIPADYFGSRGLTLPRAQMIDTVRRRLAS
jgi:hypothetical protein